MPKIVDPEARRRAVAQAVLAVVAQRGLEGASLRNVAEEAGLAIGSVRHYFTDHDELMIFAMRELGRRTGERIRAHAERLLAPDGDLDRRAATEELLAEFLPLDDARREEAVLWITFTAATHTRPELRPCAAEMQQDMRDLVARVLSEARRMGGMPADLEVDVESRRLTALLDGLTLQAALLPDRMPPKQLRQVLRRHLDALRSGG
ncbi:TetR family transcriptional regulator C-terminal domain-containing protein [Streptomyces sp. CT34]|uniref:TetR/AcrR family transcriptional regulator n=1 Tax=Streptomyces sp. CT34 TaxID=1553907 RepID=UPI0005BE0D05|nr:TetR family transcriptional regulator C-terminal domain-containing protein [Streptomyces sp. CT34]